MAAGVRASRAERPGLVRPPRLTRIRPFAATATISNRRSLRHGGGWDSRAIRELCRRPTGSAHTASEAVVINKVRDCRVLERESITTGHVGREAEDFHARESESFIKHHSDRVADREAVIRDHALEAIDEAITKSRADLSATKPVRQPEGLIVEGPAWVMTQKDPCVILDRFGVLFARPFSISGRWAAAVQPSGRRR